NNSHQAKPNTNMTTSFERVTGPRSDLNELEYISALHQTGAAFTRKSGTVSALDVIRFLKSRYGLEISPQESRDILQGLSGGGRLSPQLRQELAQAKVDQHKAKLARLQENNSSHYDKNASVTKVSLPDDENDDDQSSSGGGGGGESGGIFRRSKERHKSREKAILQALMLEKQQQHNSHSIHSGNDSEHGPTTMNASTKDRNNSLKVTRNDKKEAKKIDKELTDLELLIDEMKEPKMMYMDIISMLSIILIPTIARAGKDWTEENKNPDFNEGVANAEISSSTAMVSMSGVILDEKGNDIASSWNEAGNITKSNGDDDVGIQATQDIEILHDMTPMDEPLEENCGT
ncbi:MAG: hypothetical protein SGARI_006892, partial [Bacillariaceae sp.]